MRRRAPLLLVVVLLSFGLRPSAFAHAGPAVAIAAAANLVYVLDALNAEFKRTTPAIAVTTATGASGSLFAQIAHGAPFDVFLSADTGYPAQVAAQGLGPASSLRIFATGRLVVWTTRADLDLNDLSALVRATTVRKVAIAQPKTAPYGRAAQATLEKLGAWSATQSKIVLGESISQTAQFVETGNADLGFVALSLVLSPRLVHTGRWREIPPELFAAAPLDHAAVLTTRGAANPAAQRFFEFLGGDAAKKILRASGYRVP